MSDVSVTFKIGSAQFTDTFEYDGDDTPWEELSETKQNDFARDEVFARLEDDLEIVSVEVIE